MSYRVPSDIAWTLQCTDGGLSTLYLARLPCGPISVLDGTAALIWLAAVEGPSGSLIDRVADEAGRPVNEVATQVDEFLTELIETGYLEGH